MHAVRLIFEPPRCILWDEACRLGLRMVLSFVSAERISKFSNVNSKSQAGGGGEGARGGAGAFQGLGGTAVENGAVRRPDSVRAEPARGGDNTAAGGPGGESSVRLLRLDSN